MRHILSVLFFFPIISVLFTGCSNNATPKNWQWETIPTEGKLTARHEAGMVAYKGKLYLMGGRRINPTSVFDPSTNTWTEKSATPIELHHLQPVVFNDAIYLIGAMTGTWPNETPVERVIIYYPEHDEYVYGDTIPEHRRRGGAGAVVYNNKIYLIGGITNGHMNGYKPWFDEYDPETSEWKALDDAPNARDHFHAAIVDNKLYAFAGRTTSKITDQDMALTVSHGNVYNFNTQEWETVTNNLAIPTMRAGNFAFAWNNSIVIGGGETAEQVEAHNEVEAYNTKTKLWSKWPSFNQGRHGTGFAVIGNYVYVTSGCGKHGGEPELTTIERLELPKGDSEPITETLDTTPVFMQWHTITLSFYGPETSELANENPFLNYRLSVEFKNKETQQTIRGFYAADGIASETSSNSGSIWQVRFTPDVTGNWSYAAKLYHGDSIALSDDPNKGELISISNAKGNFIVTKSDKEGDDFRAHGRIEAANGYFKFRGTNNYWLKAGTNSPENLLAYVDFDNTYRMKAEAREGEAAAPTDIHSYEPHLKDWKTGDPTWKKGKGKSLIGAINYLASKGMNSAYFLTLNILGDGKDVWPYVSPDDFTRFDVSKLDQWEIIFEYMQSKGILLHVVLQETENETLLDNGDTGPLRKLYYNELIARFGHHPGLIWNLGEENGQTPWAPDKPFQDDEQRKAMAKYIKENDPYSHPVVLHTLPNDDIRKDILNKMLGYKYLDGISLQHAERETAPKTVSGWKAKSDSAGHPWLITMDEIGMWYDGAMTDSEDPNHNTLRRYALWGTLLSGGAGVEWYFGAKHPHNDLTSENWRQRNRLWEITNYAKEFFNAYLPYWEMQPEHGLVNSKEAYCLHKKNEIYAIYLPDLKTSTLNLSTAKGRFSVKWFNPLSGNGLQTGSVESIDGGGIQSIGNPPEIENNLPEQDWVVLVKRL
ncbi:MAG: Kelch repeat-containing protein [Bacteroidota bacterium]